jgi:hypothetical protein
LYWLFVSPAVVFRKTPHGSTTRAAAIRNPSRTSCSGEANAVFCLSCLATTPVTGETIVV